MIPSPFNGSTSQRNQEKFMDEIDALVKKYGYNQVFVAFSEAADSQGEEDNWYARSNEVSEGMVDYIRDCTEFMEEQLRIEL